MLYVIYAEDIADSLEKRTSVQDLRAGHQTAGNSHPLGHAAGKLRGQRAGELAELHARQHLQCPLALRRPGELFICQAEHHVVEHVKPREQARLLKHNAALFAHAGDRLAVIFIAFPSPG